MLPEEFHEELRKNGIVLTEEQMEKFAVYFERLVE
ncbi:16S rRNA (guanine(527)-N(7))-methyltransferase RsmG, partial [Listeria monocytogenes]|nr:16S rRNA (guanine(527)-N(7))-methyltransferase RsmG [Listeria monocytogenes]